MTKAVEEMARQRDYVGGVGESTKKRFEFVGLDGPAGAVEAVKDLLNVSGPSRVLVKWQTQQEKAGVETPT